MSDVRLALIGAATIMTGLLFLVLVIIAANTDHAVMARDAALADVGVTYLSYLAQWPPVFPRAATAFLVALSVALGAASGVLLLFGI